MNIHVPHRREAVIAAWRVPFANDRPTVIPVKDGMTITDIVAGMPGLPAAFDERGIVMINDHEVPRALWSRVRPKASPKGFPVTITLHLRLEGGRGSGSQGGGRGKASSIIAIVAMVALAFVTFGISNFGAAALGISSFAAKSLALAVGIAGSLAISALTAPPSRKPTAEASQKEDKGPASASGNVLEPGGSIPRVVGTRKIFPPLACQPLVELVGDDEIVEALYCLAGPHQMQSPRIGEGDIADAEDIEYETREGWQEDEAIDLVSRYGITTTPQIEMSAHDVKSDAQDQLDDQSRPEKMVPIWHQVASRKAPEEIWLSLAWPEGISDTAAPTTAQQMPIRIRFRKRGDSAWINCPEIHQKSVEPGAIRRMIKFKWGSRPAMPTVPTEGWVAAFKSVPASAVSPFTGGWTADAHFTTTGANDLSSTTTGVSGVANTVLEYNQVTFYLDSAVHLPGIYEFQVMRGLTFVASSLTIGTYSYAGQVQDFFGYGTVAGVHTIARSRKGIQERCYLMRIASVWNEHPVAKPGLALIAIKAKNRSIDQLSVIASGYVKDWDGTGWNTWTTTSNPAPHFVDILTGGDLNPDPLPTDLLDNDGMVDWRTRCVANGYFCDGLFAGEGLDQVLEIVASCGYARPYRSDIWGVTQDYDRSAEPEVQVFTPRNSDGFSFDVAFSRLPDGFRVIYPDKENNYESTEMVVLRDGISTGTKLERVAYEGIVDEAKAEARALFDLRQAEFRARFYQMKAPLQAIICRRGDLVAVQHDVLDRHSSSARIIAVERNTSGQVVSVYLDGEIDAVNEVDFFSITDFFAVAEFFDIGVTTGVIFQGRHGQPLNARTISNATGSTDVLTFSPGFIDDEVLEGRIAVTGPNGGTVVERLIVSSVTYSRDKTADIILVDEAPELWS